MGSSTTLYISNPPSNQYNTNWKIHGHLDWYLVGLVVLCASFGCSNVAPVYTWLHWLRTNLECVAYCLMSTQRAALVELVRSGLCAIELVCSGLCNAIGDWSHVVTTRLKPVTRQHTIATLPPMHSQLMTHTAHTLPTYPVRTLDTLPTRSQHLPDIIPTRSQHSGHSYPDTIPTL
jgi:hypothetical protein